MWPKDELERAERRLAVYGTLAPGGKNAWVIEPLGGTWCEGVVRGRRIEADWSNTEGYPSFVPDPAGDEVAVQVLESAELPARWAEIDAFEGDAYERIVIDVRSANRTFLANIYAVAKQAG